jgi:hypothetical protein
MLHASPLCWINDRCDNIFSERPGNKLRQFINWTVKNGRRGISLVILVIGIIYPAHSAARGLGMSADTFGQSSACPLCHRGADFSGSGHLTTTLSSQLVTGLLTCNHCRSRFVVGINGHCVRDPFSRPKSTPSPSQLRRQSWPIARLLRDAQSPLTALIGVLLFLGLTATPLRDRLPVRGAIESWPQLSLPGWR